MTHEPMQNSSSIVREAKGLTQSLKESLKKHEPWDREIEFQRANLRRQYLQLIFVHPYAKESKDADHSLWMTTSYYIIAAYKQRIAAADAVAHQSGSETHAHGRGHNQQGNHHGKPSGVVEHRKLVHRFRQFLAEEEKFWTNLIVRIVRVFDLEEAKPALSVLGILVSDPPSLEGSPSRSDRRNVFPSEDATEPPSEIQKELKLIMLSKAIVCLGDIARYREHYNEGGGRPRAGKDFHDDSKSAHRGRGGRRGVVEQPPRPRNYTKAQECYERARLLVPDVGNACHQLAILANYQQDPFVSVLQYYRAMCIKQPYETAAANLDNTLSRHLEGYKVALAKLDSGLSELSQSPKIRVERFKKSLVALHGLWKLEPAQAETQLPGHAASIISSFSALVSDRVLPTDVIWKTLVLAIGALWRFRILRDPNAKRDPNRGLAVEARIFGHILNIMRTLFQIGCVQLTDASTSPEPAVNGTPLGTGEVQADLAQNITAVFRRTLPALRIGSKWLSVHFSYLSEASSRLSQTDVDIVLLMTEFWTSYLAFSTLLGRIFPKEKLPKMTQPLEEDVDVSGFAPLKRSMFNPNASSANGLEPGQSQVHPNEEQLMRIADLLDDAVKISTFIQEKLESDVAPKPDGVVIELSHSSHQVVTRVDSSHTPSKPCQEVEIPKGFEVINTDVHPEADDDSATVSTTHTDDDTISWVMNMKPVLPSDEDDDEMEEVVYPRDIAPPISTTPSNFSNETPSARAKQLPPHKSLTAEDLVNDMMRPRGSSAIDSAFSRALPSISSLRPPPGSPLPPSLLFGSGSPDAPTSIWSTTTHDPASLSATNLRVTGYLGSHSRMSPPAVQTYTAGLGHEISVTSSTPTRAGYGHQRQLSQPLAYPPPSSQHHGAWASQESSHSSILQSQSQPRHTFSPPSASFAPQQPVVGAGGLSQAPSPPYAQMHQQQQSALFPGPSQSPFSQHIPNVPLQQIHSPSVSSTLHQGLPSHSTWSYSGEGSLTGIGAPLGPFTSDLPYAQSRIQQQAQMQRSGAWAPS